MFGSSFDVFFFFRNRAWEFSAVMHPRTVHLCLVLPALLTIGEDIIHCGLSRANPGVKNDTSPMVIGGLPLAGPFILVLLLTNRVLHHPFNTDCILPLGPGHQRCVSLQSLLDGCSHSPFGVCLVCFCFCLFGGIMLTSSEAPRSIPQ